ARHTKARDECARARPARHARRSVRGPAASGRTGRRPDRGCRDPVECRPVARRSRAGDHGARRALAVRRPGVHRLLGGLVPPVRRERGSRPRPARIWVADDAAASSSWERSLLLSAAPGIEVRVVNVAAAAAAYAEEAAAPGGAFLLVRDLASARALVEAGAAVPAWNLG